MESKSCKACRSRELKNTGYEIHTKGEIYIFECERCGTIHKLWEKFLGAKHARKR